MPHDIKWFSHGNIEASTKRDMMPVIVIVIIIIVIPIIRWSETLTRCKAKLEIWFSTVREASTEEESVGKLSFRMRSWWF